MKKAIFLFILLLSIINVQAQDWNYDLAQAQKKAQNNNQKIILVFQGSDWCTPCIKLERTIWNSATFQKLAKGKFVMLKADFPRKKKNQLAKVQQEKNDILAAQYNPHGYFPYVVVLDKDGTILGATSYKRKLTPTDYFELLNAF